jgi:hypothetical protein
MKTLTSLITLFFLAGCASNADWGKYRAELPTLQLPNNNNTNKFEPLTPHDLLPDPFLVDGVSALLAKMERNPAPYRIDPDIHLVLHQAWDYQHPNVSPAFVTKEEAQEYADGNNISDGLPTGHKYVVREINHRYEVRHQNDAVNDVIYTSYTLNGAEQYLNTYKANHTDLFIFDLMECAVVGVNTP